MAFNGRAKDGAKERVSYNSFVTKDKGSPPTTWHASDIDDNVVSASGRSALSPTLAEFPCSLRSRLAEASSSTRGLGLGDAGSSTGGYADRDSYLSGGSDLLDAWRRKRRKDAGLASDDDESIYTPAVPQPTTVRSSNAAANKNLPAVPAERESTSTSSSSTLPVAQAFTTGGPFSTPRGSAGASSTGATGYDSDPNTGYASPVRIVSPQPSTQSSTKKLPRFDARGYPVKDGSSPRDLRVSNRFSGSSPSPLQRRPDSRASTSSNRSSMDGNYLASKSRRSSVGDAYGGLAVPDTLAGAKHASMQSFTSFYPPSLAEYMAGTEGGRRDNGPGIAHSIYTASTPSVLSLAGSDESGMDFANHDQLEKARGVGDFSINRKGRREFVSMLVDPTEWAGIGPEDDDDLHNPGVEQKKMSIWRALFTARGASNLGCVLVLCAVLIALFMVYPIVTAYRGQPKYSHMGGYNIGGINASGQLPDLHGYSLIDKDTPPEAYRKMSVETGEEWELVFSDEFNHDGRTFYDGDDPYWQAENLHYWATNNLEWYDPANIVTRDGNLVLTLNNHTSHGMNYTGGLMSSWNRFCFTGGYIETNVSLPGKSNIYGLWPAIWTLGNLGRAGYGGTLEGMWPYSYDSCDVGTLPNQTLNGLPKWEEGEGDWAYNNALSYLPGQRLSRCSCPDDPNHPGPLHPDGSLVGRAAPEIDVFEAFVDDKGSYEGRVSLSAQWAPFNPQYLWPNTSDTYFHIYDNTTVKLNNYRGSAFQQATSATGLTNQQCYTAMGGCFSIYGFEYLPDRDNGYITWISDNKKAWTVRASAMGPNARAQVGQRIISEEPMYIIINLGISENFGAVDYEGLKEFFPYEMLVDYIRVYQDPKAINIGCEPPNYPTQDYIKYLGPAYWNANISTFDQAMEANPNIKAPRNRLLDGC
ncbi:hypothetical protein Q8F55_002114 [Vanrija albida]|uniref:GH16 domain-containing protein n=1 Tax=Vanrija albida TaxID=181172 RepID=A0ABR3Q8V8_9TREE